MNIIIEPATSWFPVGRRIQLSHRGRQFFFFKAYKKYIQLTLIISTSLTHLSRITAYLKVKIWSQPKYENLTTDKKKYCGKEEKLLLRSNFSSFPQYFQYISNFKSTHIFVKCGCSNYFFLNSANLIYRGTDILKLHFGESLGIQDNESRLYFTTSLPSVF